jgi:hypothetical protein
MSVVVAFLCALVFCFGFVWTCIAIGWGICRLLEWVLDDGQPTEEVK